MSQNIVVAIDLGGSWIKGGIIDKNGQIILKKTIPTEAEKGYSFVKSNIVLTINKLLEEHNCKPEHLEQIVIAVPGWVKNDIEEVVWAPNLFWLHKPLAREIREELGIKVIMLNDADAAAVGEYYCGTGKTHSSFLMVTVGTGIGSGYINKGNLIDGSSGMGVELGHVRVASQGPLCNCKAKGCLEALVSGRAMVSQAEEIIKNNKDTIMKEYSVINIENIFKAALNGDSHALELVENASTLFGIALSNAVLILDPSAIVLGGGVISANGGEMIIKKVEEVINDSLERFPERRISVERAVLKNDAGMIGAGLYYYRTL